MRIICITILLFSLSLCLVESQEENPIKLTLRASSGFCLIDIENLDLKLWSVGSYDFLVISNKYPVVFSEKEADGFIKKFPVSALNQSPMPTGVAYKNGLWASYVSYDYLEEKYKILAVSNMSMDVLDSRTMVGLNVKKSKDDYAILEWPSLQNNENDFVALFDKYPIDPKDYISDQWQYARKVNSYMTDIKYSGGLWGAYLRKAKPDRNTEILGISEMTKFSSIKRRKIKIWYTLNLQNRIVLNWIPPESVGKNDFIGIYENKPVNTSKHMEYQWIVKGNQTASGHYMYETKQIMGSSIWIAYVSQDSRTGLPVVLVEEKL